MGCPDDLPQLASLPRDGLGNGYVHGAGQRSGGIPSAARTPIRLDEYGTVIDWDEFFNTLTTDQDLQMGLFAGAFVE